MDILRKLIDEKINRGDIDCFDINEFSNLEKIDKRIHGTLIKANWENRKITIVLKNLNNSDITESSFKEFITRVWMTFIFFFCIFYEEIIKYLRNLFYNTVTSFL